MMHICIIKIKIKNKKIRHKGTIAVRKTLGQIQRQVDTVTQTDSATKNDWNQATEPHVASYHPRGVRKTAIRTLPVPLLTTQTGRRTARSKQQVREPHPTTTNIPSPPNVALRQAVNCRRVCSGVLCSVSPHSPTGSPGKENRAGRRE